MRRFSRFRCLLALGFCLPVATIAQVGGRFPFTDYLQPDFFPILPWDPLHGWDGKAVEHDVNGLESIAACHFNFAGFVLPKDLPKCRKLGLAAIVLPMDDALLPPGYRKQWRDLAQDEIESRVKTLVRSAGSNPACKGFFIMDEPSVKDFSALGKAVAAVKKYAPGKIAYINLFPDYATLGAPDTSQLGTTNYTEYLERFVAEVKPQLLSYDNYMIQYSDDLKKAGAASYFHNLAEVRRVGQKHHLPCLQIVASNQLRPGHTIPSPANLRLQAYTTLAAGFRGVTWYTYYARGYNYSPIDSHGKRTLTWASLQEVNRQVSTLGPALARLSSTGIFFTDPVPATGLPTLPGRVVTSITSSAPLMLGEFSGREGDDYFILVNLSLERSASFSLVPENPRASLQEVSAIDGALRPFTSGKDGFWLTAGQGVLVKVGKNQSGS
jgi:hypothetical protein